MSDTVSPISAPARTRATPGASPKIKRRWHVLLLGLLTLLMALPGLGSIPLIDRDEARYAQSSVQMVETGDWVEIRLGDEARNKKPVGAYWAQALSIVATGGLKDAPGQTLWAQRLPSVIAGMIAVWLAYWAAIPMVGRRAACLAGAMLATSLIFVFEAHIAKTDALLLASCTAAFAALARLRAAQPKGMSYLFWGGLGAATLIKGPVGPAIAALALIVLFVWERKARWAKPLLNPLAILLFILIVVPWLVAIGIATDGQFFADSLGGDFGGKIVSTAENHGGIPGYYAATIWISLWPAALFLIPGLIFAWQAARRGGESLPARGMRLVLAWVVPFWVILELVPTKLIHYPLPLFPALCAAMAGAAMAIVGGGVFTRTRWVSGIVFIIASAVIIGVIASVQVAVGLPQFDILTFGIAGFAGLCALLAAIGLFTAKLRVAVGAGALASIPLSFVTYGVLAPNVEAARTSEAIVAVSPKPILSPTYTEASLRYYGGTDQVITGDDTEWERWDSWTSGTLAIDQRRTPELLDTVTAQANQDGICLGEITRIDGINYSRGEEVEIVLLQQVPCPTPAATDDDTAG